MAFTCETCGKLFAQKRSLTRHQKSHDTTTYRCEICDKTFNRLDSFKRHQKQHDPNTSTHECDFCGKKLSRRDSLLQHRRLHDKPKPGPTFWCRPCNVAFDTAHALQVHREATHPVASTSRPQKRVSTADGPRAKRRHIQPAGDDDEFPFAEDPEDVSEELIPQDDDGAVQNLYRQKWSMIRTQFKRGQTIQDTYNFRLVSENPSDLADKVWAIFGDQQTVFKINLSFGFILQDGETGALRYFYPCENNNGFLPEPVQVENEDGIRRFLDKIEEVDHMEQARQERPNSKTVLQKMVNVTFYVHKIKDHPIGAPGTLKDYIRNSRSIIALQGDRVGPYTDKLCFFRCLALHRQCDRTKLERTTKKLFKEYLAWVCKTAKQFKGVSLKHLEEIETLFEVDVYVYALQHNNDEGAEEGDFFAELVRRPLSTHNNTMYLNLCEQHYSYIKDFKTYAKSYACPQCGKRWPHRGHCERHIRTCDGKVNKEYPGGAYHLPQTIFEKLQDEGIVVPEEDRYYPYRACFDIECLLKPLTDQKTDKMTWEAAHELLSVSVCSNVPEYTDPECFVSEGDPTKVAEDLLNFLQQISRKAYSLLLEKFHWAVLKMEEIRQRDLEKEEKEEETEEESPKDIVDKAKRKEKRRKEHYMTKLIEELTKYMSQLVVLSFNGGKYDLNAIKKVFLPLLLRSTSKLRPIKKNNTYMSIETDDLKFLDLINYVAPGFSYSILLKAYGCQETKGFFPYEWMDSLDKLEHTRLPPRAAFHSNLRQSDISEEDYLYCQRVWEEQGMTTMRDFLIWYNNKDVSPMVEAVQKMTEFYQDKGIDMFKDGISVPGLTLKYLFMNLPRDTYFTVPDNEDVYRLYKDNIVGGPSIIFHRYHEKGKTYIRADEMTLAGREPKPCQKVIGYDANALYLWALMQDMPSGHYIRRREDTGFEREYSTPQWGRMAVDWLDWLAQERNLAIRHKFNSTEKRIGSRRIPVDGFCSATGQIFQFHGCYWHGHACSLTRGQVFNDRRGKSFATLRAETAQTTEYLRACGYTVTEMWECQWRNLVRADVRLASFLEGRKTPTENLPDMTSERVLQAVRSKELFGTVECDIEVPADLKSRFAEMPPIFKNVEISIDDIGEHMKKYAVEHRIMSKPRRSLIGSMFGQKILLASPLLNWYLDHGLKVTRIYQVMEYRPKPSFKAFGDAVSDARRKGDEDKAKKIIADTMKLIGNSGYGKTVTNKEKQTDVEYCQDVVTATRKINTQRFRHLIVVNDDNFFEIESAKRTIKFNLPMQIGFFVYQYAKLRMLAFYYDFMLKFVDVSDFQYCEMDTDSAYIAISADKLEDVIKPDMRDSYFREKSDWFPRTDTKQNAAYDKRTPGLFKEEWSGSGIVGLCSKTYYCFGGDDTNEDKFSCKGVSKRCNDINHLKYLNVLQTKKSGQGINKGFRVRESEIHTYTQIRDAFSYFYPKRKVKNDRVTTLPLDI
ncbi:uncharacterized protein LOC144876010 [Branchiostoma floridae x Branchiostoma japonicum]